MKSSFKILSIFMLLLVQNIYTITTVSHVRSKQQKILYDYYRSYDYVGGDLRRVTGITIAELRALCDADSACTGFNTSGYLKNAVMNPSLFTNRNNNGQGVYVKHMPVSQYQFIQATFYTGGSYNCPSTIGGTSVVSRTAIAKPACDKDPICVGYTTDGCLKSSVAGSRFLSTSAASGTYIKTSTTTSGKINGYSFYYGVDSQQGDIKRVSGTIDQFKAACDSDSTCVGFNTSGYLKKTLTPTSQWTTNNANLNLGLYLKGAVTYQP